MQSEPAIEHRAAARGRRRKRGNDSVEGPVFVDTSGRRSKVLRRIGLLLGAGCLAYAAVLGAAFMGWGTDLTPSSLLPFGDSARGGPGGLRPAGGHGDPAGRPSGAPTAAPTSPVPPTGAASPIATPTASAAAD
ncbi:hypothetical protein OG739_21385 [Streptomyces longwoodensis]|uniref:hypothetical protein n=1 Tax=Streptomyces TaxID=1883 RepID=UPI001583A0FE|nr:hypothetical protein [Streptomyces lasalocidi]WRY90028.1 hypothetical protein OG481_16605 [Streptomyces longwoodensis]WTI45660.1 hypothetical protein OG547_14665 [Streptomyces longwoodensis]WUC58470.1 hypothetical protein OHA09_15865 [Streptomyces longwoodensis]WUC71993.1 hypothetical protein OG416_14880 [Streptomyces longwoodensis]